MNHCVRRAWSRTLFCACLLQAAGAAADWRLEQPPSGRPVARVADPHGAAVALYRDDSGQILLEFRIKPGFSGLARESCPTFQVDTREPLFHTSVGAGCAVEADRALLTLATVAGRRLESQAVYDLMNGERLAFRYVTEDGTYREITFTLTHSADAIRGAVGRDVRIGAE